MLVEHASSSYTLINELSYFFGVYSAITNPKPVFYELWSPFLMDSQAEKKEAIVNGEKRRIRKRRRIQLCNAPEFLMKNAEFVSTAYGSYVKDYPKINGPMNSFNNRSAREEVKSAPSAYGTIHTANIDLEKPLARVTLKESNSYQLLGHSIFRNSSDKVLSIQDSRSRDRYLIPPHAEFIAGDVPTSSRKLADDGFTCDFLLMDPPWPNKSVKRKHTYECFEISDLQKLPIDRLLSQNNEGLLCIWLTNSRKVHDSALRIIEEEWDLVPVAKWHWLKICRTNEPVFEFNPNHKVPFESLLFACRGQSVQKYKSLIKEEHCIISVPNAFPSRKPPISPILQEMGALNKEASLCELYARYLLPHTMSIGFEATKFQCDYYFQSPSSQCAFVVR